MIDGDGFHSLIVAELNRASSFGREDGLAIAKWSEIYDTLRLSGIGLRKAA